MLINAILDKVHVDHVDQKSSTNKANNWEEAEIEWFFKTIDANQELENF
jgi:hypothetical protein